MSLFGLLCLIAGTWEESFLPLPLRFFFQSVSGKERAKQRANARDQEDGGGGGGVSGELI